MDKSIRAHFLLTSLSSMDTQVEAIPSVMKEGLDRPIPAVTDAYLATF